MGKKRSYRLRKAAALFSWIENFLSIRLKKNTRVKVGGKLRNRQLVKFRFNAVQMILAQALSWAWHEGRPFKVLTPKARQLGSSTFWQAVFFAMCVLDTGGGYKALTIAHVDDSAGEIFGKTKTFQNHMAFPLELESRQEGKYEWINESAQATGTVKTSDALARGWVLSGLHLSECANYSDKGLDAENAISSALQALSDSPDAIVAYESTANGQDPFFSKECERARDPKSGTENSLIFLPWFLMDEYSMSWREYKARLKGKSVSDTFELTDVERALREKLSHVEVTKETCWYRYRWDLTDEQLIWRRFTISNVCFDRVDLFQRAYPSTYEEAFTSTARSLFSAETRKHYLAQAKNCKSRGELVEIDGVITFTPDSKGTIAIWEKPTPGHTYVIGADVGGLKDNADPNAAYVLDAETRVVCAWIHGHYEFDHYAANLCRLGTYYNFALLVVENNQQPAVAKTCFRLGYPNLYHYMDDASIKAGVAGRPGFNTNLKTKPELVAALQAVTRDRGLISHDIGFAREMLTFVQSINLKTGLETYGAAGTNKDDRIMAMAIAILCCPAMANRLEILAEKNDPVYQSYLDAKRAAEEEEDQERFVDNLENSEILVL